MPGVARTGMDAAGGAQLGGGQNWVTVDGARVVVRGDPVQSHAPCPTVPSHCAATMAGASNWWTIDGIGVCRAGDAASCGHLSTGADWWGVD